MKTIMVAVNIIVFGRGIVAVRVKMPCRFIFLSKGLDYQLCKGVGARFQQCMGWG